MALSVASRLGPYEIVAPLGAGGMGEVYRARDTRLERTVAIKILSSSLVASPDLKARFEREARIISQLQHPNICVLHDVGSEDGTDFLVMEFLEGESLGDRLKKGPLPAPELLRIAIELADALEKAHRAGVIHRDLKPGNVMLTKSGAKLLDFGLAKPSPTAMAAGTGSGRSASVFAALTQTSPAPSPASPLSSAGSVIGTVQYMSPEQIQGMEADARSDIFAFGVMLFEMATGKRAFEGKTQASIVGQILAVDPPSVSQLQPSTPPGLARLTQICLEKDPDERVQSAHDLRLQLEAVATAPEITVSAPSAAPARLRWLPWAVAAVFAIAAALVGWLWLASRRTPTTSVHSFILPPDKSSLAINGNSGGLPVLSPDGKRLAFVASTADGQQMLWVQPLNSSVAQPLAGTQGASYPFWSADSRYLAFFANQELNRIDASGGPPQALCPAPSGRGGAWSMEGTIIFAPASDSALMRVDAGGGTAFPLTTLQARENSQRWPQFLPDGKHYFYFAHSGDASETGIYLAALGSNQRTLLLQNDSGATYAAGYLLFVRDNTLMAQRFDPGKLALEGDAQPLADHVAVNTDVWAPVMTASQTGELLYQGGSVAGGSQLVWYDRSGRQGSSVFPENGNFFVPALSPDGTKLALTIDSGGMGDIWVVDLTRNTRTRLTFGPADSLDPVWWPDGKSIVYASGTVGSPTALVRKNADGTGPAETLLDTSAIVLPASVSPDGRYLVFMRLDPKSKTGWDIFALPMFGDKKPFPLVQTQFIDASPAVSPNGKWLAYSNNESGQMQVYLQPFPSGPGKWQVSVAGGYTPQWRRDGRELYYANDQQFMAVEVAEDGGGVRLGTPHLLFKAPMVSGPYGPYTASADGKKFLINQLVVQASTEPLTLVTSWPADLKK
ncbi:MAG TPA: protein kinase [Acidobacteriaceae bacterium]|nr:protein kinase [Acidobacteriaceae bacterium]